MICYAAELALFVDCVQYEEVEVIVESGSVASIRHGQVKSGKSKLSESESGCLKLMCRYRDDTDIMISSDVPEEVIEVLEKVVKIYPEGLVYNVTVSQFYSSHLDVCYILGLTEERFETFVRKTLDCPVTYTPEVSNMSQEHKLSFCVGEYVRYYRICSQVKYVDMYMRYLFSELHSVGYDYCQLKRDFSKRKASINKILERNENKDDVIEEEIEWRYLGATCAYDGQTFTHRIVQQLLFNGNGVEQGVSAGIMAVPGMKLKGYVMSRRKYLASMRGEKSKK